jgi:uncharacterized protein (DUF885 family)
MARKAWAAVAGLLLIATAASAQDAPPQTESDRLLAWMEQKAAEHIARLPRNWPDPSQAAAEAEVAAAAAELAELRASFDPAALDEDAFIQFRLYEFQAELIVDSGGVGDEGLLFTAIAGPHAAVPNQLSFGMPVPAGAPPPGLEAAEAYLARLESADDYLDAARVEFERRAGLGVLPPRVDFAALIEDSQDVLAGAPFELGPPSELLLGVSRAIAGIEATEAEKAELLNRAAAAMTNELEPAYRRLIAAFERFEAAAPEGVDAWHRPRSEGAYAYALAANTTLELTAEEIHALGLAELDRIEAEVKVAMPAVGFEGSVAALWEHLRTDDRYYYPDTDEGRAAYIAEATRVIEEVRGRLGEIVPQPPNAAIEVRRPPPGLEAEASAGQYAPLGARFRGEGAALPAASFVVNLSDMRAQPRYLLQALAYHEALPGHHLQAGARRAGEAGRTWPRPFLGPPPATAHIEGWGLYAEQLPYEMGLYTDPLSDVGRLGMEAWRAARLVVDTGIHAQDWSREEAVTFMRERTPLTDPQIEIEVDRYARMPGQATAYTLGKLKILELRDRARAALGEDFDLRAFHAEVLGHGQLPLPVLEAVIDRWIAERAERQADG